MNSMSPHKITLEELATMVQKGFVDLEERLTKKIDSLSVRIDRVEEKINSVEEKLNQHSALLIGLEKELGHVRQICEKNSFTLKNHEIRIRNLENKEA
jgi:hypothetical protein